MKKLIILALMLSITLVGSSFAVPMNFDIWRVDANDFSLGSKSFLGTVSAFSGAESAVDNYNYFDASGHPINGPTPAAQTSNFWLYYGSDGLSFNFIHGADQAGPNYWNHTKWDLLFQGTNETKLLQDDSPENQGEQGIAYAGVVAGRDLWYADFAYIRNSDGGVFGLDPTDYCDWSIMVEPWALGDITAINFASGSGSALSIFSGPAAADINPADDQYESQSGYGDYSFVVTPNCIPEPGTLLLLGSGLLMGAGYLRRKRNSE